MPVAAGIVKEGTQIQIPVSYWLPPPPRHGDDFRNLNSHPLMILTAIADFRATIMEVMRVAFLGYD
jgi:hypothetical protein